MDDHATGSRSRRLRWAGLCEVAVLYEDAARHVQLRAGSFVADPARELAIRCWPEGPTGTYVVTEAPELPLVER